MKRILYSLIIIPTVTVVLCAQQNFVLYNMNFVPQSVYINPAQTPASRINIGLPAISSIYTNFGNSGFVLNDLFKTNGNTVSYNIDELIGKLTKNNYINFSLQVDLLSFGFKVKKNYFSFNLTEKADVWLRYPKDFLDFIWKGNGAFLGTEKNFNFGIGATHYREWGFGFNQELSEKLSVGGRLKILNGMENISTKKSDVKFYTDPSDFSYRLSSDILINTSYDTAGFTNFSPTSYLFNFKNTGLGIDLGANYKYNEKLNLSASLIDLGYIRWKSNTTNYKSENPGAEFIYNGIALNAFGVDTLKFENIVKELTDSLEKTFKISDDNHDKYTTYLPTQLYIGATYSVFKKNTAGILLYSQILNKTIRPGVTFSLSSNIGKALSSTLTYSIYNRSFNNVGFGVSLNVGPVQLYAISDNVLGMLTFNDYKTSGNSSFVAPAYTKNMNLRAGLNITIDRGTHDKDGDGVRDKEDECPTVPGLKEFKGCPDKDGDKIADKDDLCPDVAGLAQFNGCPDTDGDGVKDNEDECPQEKGSAFTKGCPDADNDSIKDVEDACPDIAGSKLMKGCPDRDNDGTIDKNDKCPDKAGPPENEGCPEVKLIIYDANGTVIATIVKNKKGEFIYEKLPPDENISFQLEGDDSELSEINLIVAGLKRKLVKDKDGNFKFEILRADTTEWTKENEGNDSLKLNLTKLTPNNPQVTTQEQEKTETPTKEPTLPLSKKEKIVPDKTIAKPAQQQATSKEKSLLIAEEKKIIKNAISSLEFEEGKEKIRPSSFNSLTELANLLKKKPNLSLKVTGHTDNVGDKIANMELSKKRAEMVKKFMVLSGISHQRIITNYFGSEKPIADNKTPEGRKKNRRVEMQVVE